MRLISANVNGIRAAARRGGLDWLVAQQPDVVALQEVRAGDAQVAAVLAAAGWGEWHVAHTEARDRGRAGVAVVSRLAPTRVRTGFPPVEGEVAPVEGEVAPVEDGAPSVGVRAVPADEFAGSGRWVEADLATPAGSLTVASAYVPTGGAGTPRQELKYRFLAAVERRLEEWAAAGTLAVLTGDLNIAHTPDDLRNWKGNLGRSGILPGERETLDRWLSAGWVDVTRRLHGPGPGPYTWWSWRGKAFDLDSGWRIDYQLASPALADRAVAASVGRAGSYDRRWSDHAAVVVDYDLG